MRIPNELQLPNWLDDLIFNKLKAKYCPVNTDMVVVDWDKSNVLNYLGTYFPRSYAEAYLIFNHLCDLCSDIFNKEEISIFDFGCGTGGEIIGLIAVISERSKSCKKINIVVLDGNIHALRLFEKVVKKACTKFSILINHKIIPYTIDDFYDLSVLDSIMDQHYDIIISFKAICEFVTKQRFEQDNAYEYIVKFMLPKLSDYGVMLLADITTYNDVSQDWLPNMLDAGLEKVECNIITKNQGYNQPFFITHSQHQRDVSKIAWRLISNK